ncbi:rifin [Plasmodium reichenowi]|uniref:Rifin n=1 Tax=Plasmodium reichenowi TaxID=5854 RepID=A0A060RML8_PLARE|nr:rifin [Plasmodium reichenowi]
MKLHYSKILLFALLLNILLKSLSNVYNKNKPYIKPHYTPITTSRVLSECDTRSSIYDKDADMKSVKRHFDQQTSQRFEEYDERMQEKRQKRKEERDKNIEKIIEKDKMDKSLAEKIEKGCLSCGCGLGGVAASVGLFGGFGTYGWKISATTAAIQAAKQAGIQAGIEEAIVKIKGLSIIRSSSLVEILPNFINESNYNTIPGLVDAVTAAINSTKNSCPNYGGPMDQACNAIKTNSTYFFRPIAEAGQKATAATTESVETTKLGEVASTSTYSYSAIGYAVLAILIIILVMIIIYLILRYRRKKKMKKKDQYTKLLNQ